MQVASTKRRRRAAADGISPARGRGRPAATSHPAPPAAAEPIKPQTSSDARCRLDRGTATPEGAAGQGATNGRCRAGERGEEDGQGGKLEARRAERVGEKILRTCVHCGFCTATCPTYVLLGDELDSPRGRIYLMKQMLESGKPPTAEIVKHIDRCLSCLSCMTTCPSGVHYMHLVDHGRAYIEEHYRRPLADRLTRWLLQRTIPYPALFRLSLIGAGARPAVRRPAAGAAARHAGPGAALAPAPSPVDRPQSFRPKGQRRARVALLTGCAQQVLAPQINEATVRLLTRLGVEVVVPKGMGCCGALTHHMGREHRRTGASPRPTSTPGRASWRRAGWTRW